MEGEGEDDGAAAAAACPCPAPAIAMDLELLKANLRFREATLMLALLKLACPEDEDPDSRATMLSDLKVGRAIGARVCAAVVGICSTSLTIITCNTRLQVLLTKFPSLPPSFEKTPNAAEELKLARAVYEFAVIFSIQVKDQDAFERNFHQLKVFYMDTRGIIPPSVAEYPILGLNLMRLLAENRIAEFHTELELVPLRGLDHPCIKYAVELEQSFMEGTYIQLIFRCEAVPDETYLYFMDILAQRISDEIADCTGQAYDHLSMNDARIMLLFSSEQQLLEYISERQHEWEVLNRSVHFHMAKPQHRVGVHSLQMIKRSLCYARELERIV